MSFFKNDNNVLLEGVNKVNSPTFTLIKEDKDTYNYPVDGWYWFDTEAEAIDALGIIIEEEDAVI